MAKKETTTAAAEAAAAVTSTDTTNTLSQDAEAGKALEELTAENSSDQKLSGEAGELQVYNEAIEKELATKDAIIAALEDKLSAALEQLSDMEIQLKESQATLAELSDDAPEAETATEEENAADKPTFSYNGRKYGFTNRAPKKLNVDGVVRTQEELITDEDAMTSLIVGQSAFVKQVL